VFSRRAGCDSSRKTKRRGRGEPLCVDPVCDGMREKARFHVQIRQEDGQDITARSRASAGPPCASAPPARARGGRLPSAHHLVIRAAQDARCPPQQHTCRRGAAARRPAQLCLAETDQLQIWWSSWWKPAAARMPAARTRHGVEEGDQAPAATRGAREDVTRPPYARASAQQSRRVFHSPGLRSARGHQHENVGGVAGDSSQTRAAFSLNPRLPDGPVHGVGAG